MSYARVFLRGWSRREWLTVLVVAITAAFLLGTALLLASAGAYTETLEEELSTTATATEYDSLSAARAAAEPDEVVVPLATARVDGDPVTVAGIPPDAPTVLAGASVQWQQARFPDVSEGPVGPVSESRTVAFAGESRTVTVTVRPAGTEGEATVDGDTILPPWWYAADVSTVERLGVSSVVVFDPDGGTGGAIPTGRPAPPGTPLVAALPFLLAGVRQLLTVLSVAALGGGVLVLVVVYSVTRMAIRDRHDDIRVVRATGGAPRRLFLVLCARAATLVVPGVALGYALGVVLTNAITNLAVVAGLPITLSGTVTPAVARLLATLGGVLIVSGLAAGALAAWPAVRTPPAHLRSRVGRSADGKRIVSRLARRLGRSRQDTSAVRPNGGDERGARENSGRGSSTAADSGVIPAWLRPTLLDPRAAIPTTATLTVFVFVVLLVGSLWGAFVPLSATQSGTIMESGAAHPLNSRVDTQSAELLQSQGINASAEVIYAAVTDGEPYLVRGAEYRAFASVSDARLVDGRAPRTIDEAVIGRELARTLEVEVGDTILLGGSVTPGIRHVTVVGTFAAEGTLDDVLVVPLEATQGLATGPKTAHIIRTEDLSAAQEALVQDGQTSGVIVTGVSAPNAVAQGETFNVTVSVRNLDRTQTTTTVEVRAGNGNQSAILGQQSVTLSAREERDIIIPVSLEAVETTTLSVEGYTTDVRVIDPNALSVPDELPRRAPPGARLIVPAEAPDGSFVSGATVEVGSESAVTGSEGVAVVSLPESPGTYTIRVAKDGYTPGSRQIEIREGVARQLSARLTVRPQTGNALTKPRVDIQVANPWARRVNRTLTLVTPDGETTRVVELAAGEVSSVNISTSDAGLDQRLPPGEYDLRLVSSTPDSGEEITIATATYRVRGDDRVLSVAASGGSYSPGTPVGRAIENVFGNVQVLFGAIVVLAGFATVGGTTAAFAQAVHARGRTIGIRRATGATDRQLLRLLVVDACRIAVPSTLVAVGIAFGAMWVLKLTGVLVVFGVQLSIPTVPWFIAMAICGGVVLSATSVIVGGSRFLRVSPTRLLYFRE